MLSALSIIDVIHALSFGEGGGHRFVLATVLAAVVAVEMSKKVIVVVAVVVVVVVVGVGQGYE